ASAPSKSFRECASRSSFSCRCRRSSCASSKTCRSRSAANAASARPPPDMGEPRIRVSALLPWRGQILLCRHEKPGKEYWLLPGGGVDAGESLTDALHRELSEELGIDEDMPVEGPVCIVDS